MFPLIAELGSPTFDAVAFFPGAVSSVLVAIAISSPAACGAFADEWKKIPRVDLLRFDEGRWAIEVPHLDNAAQRRTQLHLCGTSSAGSLSRRSLRCSAPGHGLSRSFPAPVEGGAVDEFSYRAPDGRERLSNTQ